MVPNRSGANLGANHCRARARGLDLSGGGLANDLVDLDSEILILLLQVPVAALVLFFLEAHMARLCGGALFSFEFQFETYHRSAASPTYQAWHAQGIHNPCKAWSYVIAIGSGYVQHKLDFA